MAYSSQKKVIKSLLKEDNRTAPDNKAETQTENATNVPVLTTEMKRVRSGLPNKRMHQKANSKKARKGLSSKIKPRRNLKLILKGIKMRTKSWLSAENAVIASVV